MRKHLERRALKEAKLSKGEGLANVCFASSEDALDMAVNDAELVMSEKMKKKAFATGLLP